ncbi:MAG: hypothetical protein R2837_03605 [Aliarcobacter sp.]
MLQLKLSNNIAGKFANSNKYLAISFAKPVCENAAAIEKPAPNKNIIS